MSCREGAQNKHDAVGERVDGFGVSERERGVCGGQGGGAIHGVIINTLFEQEHLNRLFTGWYDLGNPWRARCTDP